MSAVEIRGSIPRGPNPSFWFPVLSSEFWTFTSEFLLPEQVTLNAKPEPFAERRVWALPKANRTHDTEPKTRPWAPCNLNSKPSRRETKQMWPDAKEALEFYGRFLPKQRLIQAIELLSDARKRRFLRRRIPKYGTMNKGFTEPELIRFLNAVEDPRMALLFTFQAILGLRIGEAVKLHVRDLNLQTQELKIDNQKGSRADCLPIPSQLFEQAVKYISDYEDAIAKAKGHLFWAETYPERNPCPYLDKNYARNVFRLCIRKLKLDETYGLADGSIPKQLHRLTTHSLRHYAITNFSKKNNGNVVLTSKFARHHRVETTMTYIHTGKEELYRSIAMAQEDGILGKVRRVQEKTL